ncbi:DNA repair protein RecO, partial [Catenulispora pinistramenti]|uniref:DNA repair protein RecO n=1 Tax=Catenulispora pinistramenti TaxID=2705254 RepID=UPI001E56A107
RPAQRMRTPSSSISPMRRRMVSRLEPFTFVDVQIFEKHGRDLHLVTQAETLAAYGGSLVADYPAYTAGQAMLEAAERLSEDDVPAVQQYLLLVGGLRTLASGEHSAGLVLDAFLLRSLAIAGYAPSFEDCARCGDPGAHRFFNLPAGGVVCSDCKPSGSVAPARETLALLGALLAGDWGMADASADKHRREGSGLVAAYLQWHLERGLRSLRLVER